MAHYRKDEYVMRSELVKMGNETIPIPVVINKRRTIKQHNTHLVTLGTWLKENPGLYQMTKKLIDALTATANVVIDDEETGIVTTPQRYTNYGRSLPARKQNATHTLSRLMLTRPCYMHYGNGTMSKTMYDVVHPEPTNTNSWDMGGWWNAFSYIAQDGKEHDYTKFNIVYLPYKSQNDPQIHRADDGVCKPDEDVAKILCKHKQAIVDSAVDNTPVHYVVVTIPELVKLLSEIQQPDFKAIAQLKNWIKYNSYARTYFKNVVNLAKSQLKALVDEPINDNWYADIDKSSISSDKPTISEHPVTDDTLITVIQYQTCSSSGNTNTVWVNQGVPWCSFVCKNTKNIPKYYVAGKIVAEGEGDNIQLKTETPPDNFPKRNKQHLDQRDVDYRGKFMPKYDSSGNNTVERHDCVILTVKELADILAEHDRLIRWERSRYHSDDY
jgi:hypothetical protein